MPELPEVETVKRGLEKIYLNKKISDVEVIYPNILANIDKDSFINNLKGQTINSFSRKGKFLIINLSNSTLLCHLRMEGKFKFEIALKDKHSHIIFHFVDGSVLIYHDVRKFGRIYYFNKDVDIFKVAPLNKIGLEPMEIKDPSYLLNKFKRISKPIKTTLLDQSIMCGIGNIYADEILFASKISPFKKAKDLTINECQRLIDNGSIILKAAIKDGGSTIRSFQSAHGVDGLFQQHLKVYGREGKPCLICNTKIEKTFINQRGTHYCPTCQKGE